VPEGREDPYGAGVTYVAKQDRRLQRILVHGVPQPATHLAADGAGMRVGCRASKDQRGGHLRVSGDQVDDHLAAVGVAEQDSGRRPGCVQPATQGGG
jgi:hypothetical protein